MNLVLFPGLHFRSSRQTLTSFAIRNIFFFVLILFVLIDNNSSRLKCAAQAAPPPSGGSSMSNFYAECKQNTALCFGVPSNCLSDSKCFFIFISKFASVEDFTFQLVSDQVKSDYYIAVAFSNQSTMSGLVTACTLPSGSSIPQVKFSHNAYQGKHNTAIENSTEVVGFYDFKSSYQNGLLHCTWNVDSSATVGYDKISFDFLNSSYYVQVAHGPLSKGNLAYHQNNKLSSTLPISLLTNGTVLPGDNGETAVKWHASLMIFGWIGCMTTGIGIARFTRDLWPDRTLFGLKLWFVFHRVLMVFGWCIIVASYITIYVSRGGWTRSTHSIIGMVAGILATLQIANSFLRPAPDSRRRWIFDYVHWFFGNAAHCLAISNILLYILSRERALLWIMIGYLFVYALFSDLLRKLDKKIRETKRAQKLVHLALTGVGLTIFGLAFALIALIVKHG